MPSHTIIEEIDEALESQTSEQLFAELLKRNDSDVKAFLASTFAYLKQHSKFFDNPEASKVLARLLRDVNAPKPSKPPSSTVHSSNGSVREVRLSMSRLRNQPGALARNDCSFADL